jgi:CHAD domain-containing protein
LRVGIRRLRAVLRVFRKATRKAKRLDQRLRPLLPPLGEARDWDVFVARHGEGKGRQRAAQVRCRAVLGSTEFNAFFVEAQRWAARSSRVGRAPLSAFAAKALGRLHRKVFKRARGVDWRDAERRHAVRIALKRLRYACDFFASCFEGSRAYLKGLEKLQDLLGDLNDIAVARRLGGAKLDQPLAKREAALVSRLAPAWAALERRRCFWRAGR